MELRSNSVFNNMSEDKIKIYERALAREKAARKQAEQILEQKSRELFEKSEELRISNLKLENLYKQTSSELKGVFENIVDAYVVIDTEGKVIKLNQAAEKLLGYHLEDDLNLFSLVFPEELERAYEAFEYLLENSSLTNFQIQISTKDGSTKMVHVNASLILNNDGLPIAAQGIVRDITQEKAAENQLKESQNRLSTLIQNLESGILLEDENRDIVITNSRFCEFFSIPVTPEQLVGQNCANAADQSKSLFADPDSFVKRINSLVEKKVQALADELQLVDGRILERDFIPVYENEIYKGHLWAYRDVTLRRRYRKNIEVERQKYRSIIANMNLGLIEVNLNDEILMVNQRLEAMSGYSEEELLGKRGSDILLVKDDQHVLTNENNKRLKGSSNSYEIRARKKDGEIRHWLISGAPQYNISGKVTGSIGIHLDITELKNLEFQKENLLKKLEKSNDELQEYAHVVSHDLKSPLRSINALVSWIREDNPDKWTEDTRHHLDMIDTTLEKMEHLISDVLEYSSVGADNNIKEPVDLNDVLKDIETLLHIPEHIILEIKKPLPSVNADRIKIQQLFQNLLSNGIRYCDKDPGYVSVDFEESANFYKFSVADNGVGIAPEFHDKIFKIFQTLHKRDDSTGIGLSIVKKIVDLYNGEIWVESNVDQGTIFHFTLAK
ncbi:PAS/PAC sensor signal transduction histidine kinase [Nonlabens sp. Hel1_33_55]|uniref:PAS domain S-box protein n=1 Tax=Nonlabens sp. Hel1_33_55 TaxID=1336802 RepID=UPI000875D155|nr:PAS domain S-box protein [Nonlabens sp. Hel1_33_55]SCX99171.1 PAS/PAC sensor signal transduction histidine kinase [Nonlabens sp. Hel1_33_55]